MKTPPVWLARFQADFSAQLTKVVDRSTGTMRSTHTDSQGLIAYNQQYWFRLFSTLQDTYPCAAQLLGYWDFNRLLERYLADFPPKNYDIGECGRAFPEFLADCGASLLKNLEIDVDLRALVQASRFDRAIEQCFLAPSYQAWSFGDASGDVEQLELKAGQHWQIIAVNWPFWELKLEEKDRKIDEFLHHSWPKTAYFLLTREAQELRHYFLEAAQAKLYELMRALPLGTALERWQGETDGESDAHSLQNWVAASMDWELWVK